MNDLISRRALLRDGTLILLSATVGTEGLAYAIPGDGAKPALRIGFFTDTHYADTDDRGARNYRTSLGKITEAVDRLNRERIDLVVHGGDLIDALPDPDPASEKRFLQRVNQELIQLKAERHYVMGNHCIFSLTKSEYLETIQKPKSYYSFDKHGFHIVILDACYRKDGLDYGRRNFDYRDTDIPAPERDWLAADLKATKKKTIVFVHQRLDLAVGRGRCDL